MIMPSKFKPTKRGDLPSLVSVVAKYWDVSISVKKARSLMRQYSSIKGDILLEAVDLAEEYGFQTLIINSTLKELKKIIDGGFPPIVILSGNAEFFQSVKIISGYDDSEKTIMYYLHQDDEIGVIPEKQFEELWEEDGRLLLLIFPSNFPKLNLKNKITDRINRLCYTAERLSLKGSDKDAINILNEAIKLDETHPNSLTLLGSMLSKRENPEAIKYYQKCIAHNKRYYASFRGLGNYYSKTKDYANAEIYYTKAIEINPKRFPPIYKNRAIARYEQDKYDESKQDFVQYLSLVPDAKDAHKILKFLKNLQSQN